MALPGAHLQPGEAVVTDVEIVGVVYVDTWGFDLVCSPLGMGPIEIQHGVAPVPAVVINVDEIMAGNRVQERTDAFTNGLINRTPGHRQQQKKRDQRRSKGKTEGTRVFIVVNSSS